MINKFTFNNFKCLSSNIEKATFICWDHIFYVNKRLLQNKIIIIYISSVSLHNF